MTPPAPTVSCPKCGATNIQFVAVKRTSVPESVAAEYFRGTGAGAAPGVDTIMQSVCSRCGCRWIPRTAEERHLRAASGQLGPEAMHAALAEDAASARVKARRRTTLPKIPKRTLVIAVIMVIVILLALLTS